MVVVTWHHQAYHMITVLTQEQTPLSTTLLNNGELHICESFLILLHKLLDLYRLRYSKLPVSSQPRFVWCRIHPSSAIFVLGATSAAVLDSLAVRGNALENTRALAPTLVLGVQSDILFPVEQQREVADALRMAGNQMVSYYELGGVWGHDTFL